MKPREIFGRRAGRGRAVEHGRGAVGGHDDVGGRRRRLEPGLDEERVEGNRPHRRLHAVIRTHEEEHVVAGGAQLAGHGEHPGDTAIRGGDRRAMRRRAEWGVVAGVVGLRQPQHRERRAPLAQDLVAEARGHRRVARLAQLDLELLAIGHRPQPRRERPGAMVDVAEPVRSWKYAAPGETLDIAMAPPWPARRSASVGRCSVRPVARRSRSRKSGLPTDRHTSPCPSSMTMVLPSRPWRPGWHPVAMDAEVTRVTDGNTPRTPA